MSPPTSSSAPPLAVAFVAGALAGAALTWLLTPAIESAPLEPPPAAPENAPPAGTRPDAADGDTSAPGAAAESRRELPDRAPAAGGAPGADFEALLREWVASELRRGWRAVRAEDMPEDQYALLFRRCLQSLLEAPAGMAAAAARRLTEEEQAAVALAGGETVEFLEMLDAPAAKRAAYVASEQFARLFQPAGGGASVTGPEYAQGSELPTGAVLAYPAGVYEVGDLANGNDPFPTDVQIRGVGMDATLLVLDANRARSPLVRFHIEDCTIYCENAITDVRSNPAVLSLHRVRVVGFDCGAGGSCAFYGSEGFALLATDCRFEAGYGRAPGSYAYLMSTDGAPLARFVRCSFERMSLGDARSRSVQFDSCTMHELLDEAPDGPRYRGCRITLCDQQRKWDADYRRRDLNELFPQWRERLQRQR